MRIAGKILLLIVCFCVLGCSHKDLCYDHAHIREIDVVFDWDNAPDASPASMSLYLYPKDNGKIQRFEFADFKGGKIRLEGGYYDAVCLNSDTRNIEVINNDYTAFEVKSKSSYMLSGLGGMSARNLPKVKGVEDERFTESPEMIWAESGTDFDLTETGSVLVLHPKKRVKKYFVEINNAENLRWIKGISAVVSTMAGGFLPVKDMLLEECVTIGFNCLYSIEDKKITGEFNSFGHCPTEERAHFLTLYVILADNSKWYYSFDITNQIHKNLDNDNIKIVLDSLPIPAPVSEGGGLKPDVKEWNEIIFDIKM